MKQGHVIKIEESFDHDRQCFHAIISLQEWRQGHHYGGAVVTEHSGVRGGLHDQFMKEVCAVVKNDMLSLLTFKTK